MPFAKTRRDLSRVGKTRLLRHARRGGRRSEKKLLPAYIDGFIQGLRSSLKEEETQDAKPPPANTKAKYKPKESGSSRASWITERAVAPPVEVSPAGVPMIKPYGADTIMGKENIGNTARTCAGHLKNVGIPSQASPKKLGKASA